MANTMWRHKKEELRSVLIAEWGDHFLIDDSESHAGFTFSRGMLNEHGDYTVMRLHLHYRDVMDNPARVGDDLRRILSEDKFHPQWLEAPQPCQPGWVESWQKQIQRFCEETGLYEDHNGAMLLQELFDDLIATAKMKDGS